MRKSNFCILLLGICLAFDFGLSEPLLWPEPQVLNFTENSTDIIITPAGLRLELNLKKDSLERGHFDEAFSFYKRKIFVRAANDSSASEGQYLVQASVVGDEELQAPSAEAYNLSVSEQGALLVVKSYEGFLRGMESFSQLIKRRYSDFKEFKYVIQNAPIAISDWPLYQHRGLALDIGSMTSSLSGLKRVIDALMYNKMTHLHLQLISNDGMAFSESGAEPSENHFSLEETKRSFIELKKYAQTRGVRVVPGVDLPADLAVLRTYKTGKYFTQFGLTNEEWDQCCLELPCAVLDLSEESLNFAASLVKSLSEFLELSTVHLGGRYPKLNESCYSLPAAKAFFKSMGLTNISDYVGTFQSRLISKLSGRSILLINDISQRNAIRLTSRNESDIVFHTLFSSQVPDPYDRFPSSKYLITPADRLLITDDEAGYVNWKAVFYFEPRFYDSRNQPKVEGGVFVIWDKKIQENILDSKIWVRASAVGERLWNTKELAFVDITKAAQRIFFFEKLLNDRGIAASPATSEICGRNPEICWPSYFKHK